MNKSVFVGDFTQQEPLPDSAIKAAERVLRSGRLHRYNLKKGETGETSLLEAEFAEWQGAPFCLAVTSGGLALQIALRAAGVERGEPVLTNAFTLAPVPGAIAALGGKPVLVEIDNDLRIDMADLSRKAEASGARSRPIIPSDGAALAGNHRGDVRGVAQGRVGRHAAEAGGTP